MADAQGHSPRSYATALAVTWTVVGVPLIYGLFHAVKAALKLFTG